MRNSVFTILILLIFSLSARGQEYLNYPGAYNMPAPGPEKYYADSLESVRNPASDQPRIRYNMSVGTSFSTGGLFGNSMQSWLSPAISYRASDNLVLSAGMVFSNNFMKGSKFFPVTESDNYSSWYTISAYASGTWFVNSDLAISGSLVKSVDQTPDYLRNTIFDRSYESLSLSVDYRLSDAVRLGINFSTTRGNPWYMNNYHSPYFGAEPFFPNSSWR